VQAQVLMGGNFMRRNVILAICFIILTYIFNTACGKNVTARDVRSNPTEATSSLSVCTSNIVSPYVQWDNGPLHDANFFLLAVWMQHPRNAEKYKDAGFNTYVALWKGPTEEQLAGLRTADMKVICNQNEVGLKHIDDPTIIGWMHDDEPDNAQSLGKDKGSGPPIPPKKIIDDYQKMLSADPTRPVLLNLSPGVAWDDYRGRGVRHIRSAARCGCPSSMAQWG